MLDELDHELEKRGHQFVRYADDFVILCKSPRAGQRILTSIKSYLKKSLKLIVNESKSKVVVLSEATFLGFSIVHRKIRWTEKSQKKFKAEVRRLTKRTRGHSPVKVIPKGADPRRSASLPSRSNQLLRDWYSVSRYPRPRSMAPPPHETLLLETVGTSQNATAKVIEIGDRQRRGPQSKSRKKRPLADEPNELGPLGHEQCLARRTRAAQP